MEQVEKNDFFPNKINLILKKVLNSFDKQINQMSTPLHHQPDKNVVKGIHNIFVLFNKSFIVESLTNELDREIEQHESQKLNATATNKHVTIVEPPTRPTASVDDFSRTNKTISG